MWLERSRGDGAGLGSWGHHRPLAARWIEPHAREALLDEAERSGCSVRELEAAVRELRALEPGLHVSSSEERREEVSRPLVRLITERRYALLLAGLVVAIPALAAANVYVQMNVPIEPPFFPRTIHPASPSTVTVHDKKIDLDAGENPFRHLENSSPDEFRTHLENGRRVYYRNCFYCHGDNMAGDGMFVHGLNPIPTNFRDSGTIPMLRETFLLWRIAKGGPGLPQEGAPWDSAMPAWEKFLKEEEMWDVILFLYDFTGQRPRAREEGHTQ